MAQLDRAPVPRDARAVRSFIVPGVMKPWDHEDLREPGTDRRWPWRANLRLLQSWWRQERLGVEPGVGPQRKGKPSGAWLPLAVADQADLQHLNFYDAEVAAVVKDRIARGGSWGGIVKADRVYRSLLSSQPVCFNAFGYLTRHQAVLLDWLQAIGLDAVSIELTEESDPSLVRIEYAPPRKAHLDSGSAFDACITYRNSDGRRCFVAIETKYAENLADQKVTTDPKYAAATVASGHWKDTAVAAVNQRSPVQSWQNVLLVQKAVEQRTHGWEAGTFVMMADGHDLGALHATAALWGQLNDPDHWVRWSPYQQVVDIARRHAAAIDWCDWFSARYLDLSPISIALLDDPNRAADVIRATGDRWASFDATDRSGSPADL